jgi:transposase InsO family protein
VSDEKLLEAIHDDLERSPFQGEGHRKIHARLRILDGIRVARKRVLRAMRENGLLSPHRGRQGEAKVHDGKIVTQEPNEMWGTDGVRVFTVDDGWVWIFAGVEHWSAECVGWHVCKVGSRFAALEPISQGLQRIYGSLAADVARGLALRMDHGSQYLSDHFLNQIRYWGIRPSFGFVEEPETNGVAERWNRTLKEQAIHGRIFRNLEEVSVAVAEFVELYNTTWRLEKLGYKTPMEVREEYELRQAA